LKIRGGERKNKRTKPDRRRKRKSVVPAKVLLKKAGDGQVKKSKEERATEGSQPSLGNRRERGESLKDGQLSPIGRIETAIRKRKLPKVQKKCRKGEPTSLSGIVPLERTSEKGVFRGGKNGRGTKALRSVERETKGERRDISHYCTRQGDHIVPMRKDLSKSRRISGR